MDITKIRRGQVTIISIVGTLDAFTAPELAKAFSAELDQAHYEMVADLAGVKYMSSAGLRVLLHAAQEIRRRRGDLRLAAIQTSVRKVLSMAGFIAILKCYATVEKAVASFG